MAWHCKPSGAYPQGSTEAEDNIWAFYDTAHSLGYSKEAIAGMLGCVARESGYNPWRWQSDKVSLTDSSKGYGLFQYTPAYGYINNYGIGVEGFGPNLSTSEVLGGKTTDGDAQIRAIVPSHKYGTSQRRINAVKPYVPNWEDYNTLDKFKTCDDVNDATAIWLAFFEGLTVNFWIYLSPRIDAAYYAYEVLGGTPPTPPTEDSRKKWYFIEYMERR